MRKVKNKNNFNTLSKTQTNTNIKRKIVFKGIAVNGGEVVIGDLLHGEDGYGYISDLPIKIITVAGVPFIPQITKVFLETLEVGILTEHDNYIFQTHGELR